MSSEQSGTNTEESPSFATTIFYEIVESPVNALLLTIIIVLIYKIWKSKYSKQAEDEPIPPPLPKIRRDFTVSELKPYDGTQPDGRVLVAVNGWVFDVTKGARFYGPGGPYSAFGGRDASRGLATFSVTSSETEYDDLSDLNSMEMESVREWEMQFKEKYELVGKLLKPGEQPTNYSDEEAEEEQNAEAKEVTGEAKKKD